MNTCDAAFYIGGVMFGFIGFVIGTVVALLGARR